MLRMNVERKPFRFVVASLDRKNAWVEQVFAESEEAARLFLAGLGERQGFSVRCRILGKIN